MYVLSSCSCVIIYRCDGSGDTNAFNVHVIYGLQAAEGPGLAFIMYSEAIMSMPLPQLWSVLYFFMLLLLGVGSMLGNIMAIATPLRDFKIISKMSTELFNGKDESAVLAFSIIQLLTVNNFYSFLKDVRIFPPILQTCWRTLTSSTTTSLVVNEQPALEIH